MFLNILICAFGPRMRNYLASYHSILLLIIATLSNADAWNARRTKV